MKGLVFQQQYEIRLEVEGETFHQGDTVPCTLKVKNRGATSQPLGSQSLVLAEGDQKSVKAKSDKAFTTLATAPLSGPSALGPAEETSASWTFELDKNCLISDKTKSLFLVYGLSSTSLVAENHLQLPVLPHRDIEGILVILETSFQFVLKSTKSRAGWVVAKLKPPSGQEYPALEELELSFRFAGDALELRYNLKVKKLSATPSSLEVQKTQLTSNQQLTRNQYAIGDYIDPKLVEPHIEAGLASVSAKFGKGLL